MDKKAQGLSTNAIILIILGVFILVIMIVGFTIGWSKIAPWVQRDNNLDDLETQCKLACSTGSKHGFCSEQREVFVTEEFSDEYIVPLKFKASCYQFVYHPDIKVISDCISIECESLKKCDEFLGKNDKGRSEVCSAASKCPDGKYWMGKISGGIWQDADMKKNPGTVCCKLPCTK